MLPMLDTAGWWWWCGCLKRSIDECAAIHVTANDNKQRKQLQCKLKRSLCETKKTIRSGRRTGRKNSPSKWERTQFLPLVLAKTTQRICIVWTKTGVCCACVRYVRSMALWLNMKVRCLVQMECSTNTQNDAITSHATTDRISIQWKLLSSLFFLSLAFSHILTRVLHGARSKEQN